MSKALSLSQLSAWVRGQVIQMSHKAGTPHLGSALSVVDILVAAYSGIFNVRADAPNDPNRDRIILSKGHAVTALYAVLAHHGFFSKDRLESFNTPGHNLPEQPSPGCAPGVELATGSLGHGLPVGIGIALTARITAQPYKVCVVMSDGECNEGSVWEGAMFAGAQKIQNLCAVVDFNKWQATGRSQEVMALDPLAKKFENFGWSAYEVDGHDTAKLIELLKKVPDGSGKPVAIIAHTVKGKGASFMENDNNWHYRIPTAEEVAKAHKELGL